MAAQQIDHLSAGNEPAALEFHDHAFGVIKRFGIDMQPRHRADGKIAGGAFKIDFAQTHEARDESGNRRPGSFHEEPVN